MDKKDRGTAFGTTGSESALPWQDKLAYSVILASMPEEADREAYLTKVTADLIAASDREWSEENRATLGETLRLFLLNETFSYTDIDGTAYVWNVTEALRIIEESPRETMLFAPVEQGVTIAHIWERYPDINEERAKTADLTRPLLFIPFQENHLLIDGWHRLFRAVSENVEALPCYALSPEEADSVLAVLEPLPLAGESLPGARKESEL